MPHSADRGLPRTATDAPLPADDPARGVFAPAFRDRAHTASPSAATTAPERHPCGPPPGRPAPAAPGAPGTRAGALRRRGLPLRRRPAPAQPYDRPSRRAHGHRLITDGGRTWRTVGTGSHGTVDCAPDPGCWAAGGQGRVARPER